MTQDPQINEVLKRMAAYEKVYEAQFAVDDETGTYLYNFVLEHRPERILELGTWRGASAIYFAAALKQLGRGQVVTVDLGNDRVEQAADNFAQAGVSGLVTQVTADIDDYLPTDNQIYDLVFFDAIKKYQGRWMKDILSRNVRPGSHMIVDDVITMGKRMSDLFDIVEADNRLVSRLEHVGDGLLVIKVLEV